MDGMWWPLAAVMLGVVFILVFRQQIVGLLDRTTHVGRDGLSTGTPDTQSKPRSVDEEIEAIMAANSSPLVSEVEQHITAELDKRNVAGEDRHRFLLRALAAMHIGREFDNVFYAIFNSQYLLLTQLNSSPAPMPRAMAKTIYDGAANANPSVYQADSFDRWLAWLMDRTLVGENQQGLFITVRGREFLQSAVRNGWRPLNNY